MSLQLYFNKLVETAILPRKNFSTDAAFDLYYPAFMEDITFLPGERIVVNTGIACIIPTDYWLKFHERSGLAAKKGIKISGGVIDSSYTGELKVIMTNTSNVTQIITGGTAVCQFTIERTESADLHWVEPAVFEHLVEFKDRKSKGFGSSDATTK